MFSSVHTKHKLYIGLLIFNDDEQLFSHPESSHIEILSARHVDIALGVVSAPVIFTSIEDFEVYTGRMERTNNGCVFNGENIAKESISGDLDFTGVSNENEVLLRTMADGKRNFHQLQKDEDGDTVLHEVKSSSISPGLSTFTHWLSELAISRAAITQSVVALCTLPKEQVLRKNRVRRQHRSVSTFAMWYPSPRPRNLLKWLEFLKTSNVYDVKDILRFSPAHEGFYRFRLQQVRENTATVCFDDAVEPYSESSCPAYILSPENGFGYIQITMETNVRAPTENKLVMDALGTGIGGGKDTVNCFVLPISEELLNGCYGPVKILSKDFKDRFERQGKMIPEAVMEKVQRQSRDAEKRSLFLNMETLYDDIHAENDEVNSSLERSEERSGEGSSSSSSEDVVRRKRRRKSGKKSGSSEPASKRASGTQ